LALAYWADFDDDLNFWFDDGRGIGGISGDGLVNGTEITTIAVTGISYMRRSLTVINGNIALCYKNSATGDTQLWIDDGSGNGGVASDELVNGSELRTVLSTANTSTNTATNAISVVNNKLAIAYRSLVGDNMMLWVDDGAGSGVAGDGINNGDELRTLDNVGTTGFYAAITESNNTFYTSYYDFTSKDLKLATTTSPSFSAAASPASSRPDSDVKCLVRNIENRYYYLCLFLLLLVLIVGKQSSRFTKNT